MPTTFGCTLPSRGPMASPEALRALAQRAEAGTAGGHGGFASATIAGGAIVGNRVTDDFGTVGGGTDNQAGDGTASTTNATASTVGGGRGNTASGDHSTVGGGFNNAASGSGSTVGGGAAIISAVGAAAVRF